MSLQEHPNNKLNKAPSGLRNASIAADTVQKECIFSYSRESEQQGMRSKGRALPTIG